MDNEVLNILMKRNLHGQTLLAVLRIAELVKGAYDLQKTLRCGLVDALVVMGEKLNKLER